MIKYTVLFLSSHTPVSQFFSHTYKATAELVKLVILVVHFWHYSTNSLEVP